MVVNLVCFLKLAIFFLGEFLICMSKLSLLSAVLPKRIFPTTTVQKAQNIYTQTTDVFEKQDVVKTTAATFKKTVFDSVSDWAEGIPADGKEGADFLKKLLAPYTVFVEKLSTHDAERFVKLVFGENQVEFIEDASTKNKDVMLLKDTLEKSLGKTIREVIFQ